MQSASRPMVPSWWTWWPFAADERAAWTDVRKDHGLVRVFQCGGAFLTLQPRRAWSGEPPRPPSLDASRRTRERKRECLCIATGRRWSKTLAFDSCTERGSVNTTGSTALRGGRGRRDSVLLEESNFVRVVTRPDKTIAFSWPFGTNCLSLEGGGGGGGGSGKILMPC